MGEGIVPSNDTFTLPFAISGFVRDTLAPGAGFGLFLTELNMITPNRHALEVGPVLSNALSIRLAPPALGIIHTAGSVTLTWDAGAIGWTLQVSDNLNSWSNLGSVITASGSYIDTTTSPRYFFRFKK